MRDTLADHAKDPLTLALAGLGITFAPYEWLGGLFLALAGAAFAMRSDPEQDWRELWLVMLGAFLASHIAALIWQRWPGDWWTMHPPVQASRRAWPRLRGRFATRCGQKATVTWACQDTAELIAMKVRSAWMVARAEQFSSG